jgi:hypothetical protein
MRVGDIACGRSGDKASTLDLTLVAQDEAAYRLLESTVTVERAQAEISRAMPGTVRRYALPDLLALKFVIDDALPGGVYASLHAGMHWQKAAAYVLLEMDVEEPKHWPARARPDEKAKREV